MDVIFYMSYNFYDDEDFEDKKDYYKDNNDFFNAVKDEIRRSEGVYYKEIGAKMLKSDKDSLARRQDSNNERFLYAKCNGIIFNENGQDEIVDNFFSKIYSKNYPISIELALDLDSADEEFEEALGSWYGEHAQMVRFANKGTDKDWINRHAPKRNMIVKLKNNANEWVCVELNDCSILDRKNIASYLISVSSANLTKVNEANTENC